MVCKNGKRCQERGGEVQVPYCDHGLDMRVNFITKTFVAELNEDGYSNSVPLARIFFFFTFLAQTRYVQHKQPSAALVL